MSLFDDLQSEWQHQPGTKAPEEGARAIRSRLTILGRESRTTAWILGVTAVGLLGFFLYLGVFASGEVILSMALMIGSLAFRIALEIYGRHRLGQMDPTLPTSAFEARLRGYYRHRRWVHLIATPVVLAAYGLGFAILLPDFKTELSPGFYTYILISGSVFALALFWIIQSQVRREFRMLRELRPGPAETGSPE